MFPCAGLCSIKGYGVGERFRGQGPQGLLLGQNGGSSPSPSLLLLGALTGSQAWGSLSLCCHRNHTEGWPKLFSWLRPPEQAPKTTGQKCPLLFSLGTNKIWYHESFWLKDKSLQKQSPGQDETTQGTRERKRERKTVPVGKHWPRAQAPSRPWQAAHAPEEREPGWTGAVEIQTPVLPDRSPGHLQALRDTEQALSCRREPAAGTLGPCAQERLRPRMFSRHLASTDTASVLAFFSLPLSFLSPSPSASFFSF